MDVYYASQFLGPSKLGNYKPGGFGVFSRSQTQGQLPFTRQDILPMMSDYMVSFGQRILRAPLHQAKWTIKSNNPEAVPYIDAQFRRFWKRDLTKACRMLEWGFAGGELEYEKKNGRVTYKGMNELAPWEIVPLTYQNKLVGIEVPKINAGGAPLKLFGPLGFWVANEARYGLMHGKSRLEGAYEPWKKKCGKRGCNDIITTFFLKNSYRGAHLRYPDGNSVWIDGALKPNREIAQQMVEWYEAGHVIALPGAMDLNGNYLWAWDDPTDTGSADGLLEWEDKLNDAILYGQGMPPELVRAAEQGGWSGRAIPAMTFYNSEDEIAATIAEAFCSIALRPMVALEYPGTIFEIEFQPLVEIMSPPEPSGGSGKGFGMPGKDGQQSDPAKQNRGNQGVRPQPTKTESSYNLTSQSGSSGGGTIGLSMEDAGSISLSSMHAPHNITIDGKFYRGGEFIPASEVAKLTEAQKAKLEARDDTGKLAVKKDEPKKSAGKNGPVKSKPTRTPPPKLSEKAERAKKAHRMIDASHQRLAEEKNEKAFAKEMGGASFPDSEPVDVVVPDESGSVAHGIELKSVVLKDTNKKLTMNKYAQVRKIVWEQNNKVPYHTVVLDDSETIDGGERKMYYRRGVAGSAHLGSMHEVKGGNDELKELMAMPEKDLPPGAGRTDDHLRVGKWKFFQDDEGKGFKNTKTGEVARAKK